MLHAFCTHFCPKLAYFGQFSTYFRLNLTQKRQQPNYVSDWLLAFYDFEPRVGLEPTTFSLRRELTLFVMIWLLMIYDFAIYDFASALHA